MAKRKNPLIPKEGHSMLTWAVGVVVAISTIGGAALYLGQPPYANRAWTEERLAGVELRYYQTKEEQLDQRRRDLRYRLLKEPNREVREMLRQDIEKTEAELKKAQDEIRELRRQHGK